MVGIARSVRSGAIGVLMGTLLAGCAEQGASGFLATGSLAPETVASSSPAAGGPAQASSAEKRSERQKAFSAASLALAAEPGNPEVVITYSRLAVELGRPADAEKALVVAEAAGLDDWRILSAKGAVLAQKGDLEGAKASLQKGLDRSPEQPALLNNLAFVYALEGQPKMAEDLLRRASAAAGAKPRTRQNLALVLGLQGKFEESRLIAAADTTPEIAEANVAYLKGLTATKPATKVADAGG